MIHSSSRMALNICLPSTKMRMRYLPKIGPAALVTAAFIGPGTITMCILTGIRSGFTLLWAMLLSIFITIFIQNTAARIAWTTRKGLAESVLKQTQNPIVKWLLRALLIGAIFIGNAAYEAGNLSGGLIGLKGMLGINSLPIAGNLDVLPLLFGAFVGLFLFMGNLRFLKNLLIGIVLLMSGAFFITALLTQPDVVEVLKGLLVPSLNQKEVLNVLGLLGTTVVPYNLFLHAALIAQSPSTPFSDFRRDTFFSVGIGGLISLFIIIAAAALEGIEVQNTMDLAKALTPLYGKAAPFLFQLGFFAAGLTSSLTAPLAAAFVVSECFGFSQKSWAYRLTAFCVLAVGVYCTTLGVVPLQIIRFAQVANGLLLPIIGLLLLFMVNNKHLMRGETPSKLQNFIFLLIEFFFLYLGVKSLGIVL